MSIQDASIGLGLAAGRWGSIVVASLLSLVAEAQTVPSIPITTPAIVPATYTMGQCPAGQVIIPPGFYAAGSCGIENYWPGRYLNLGGPPVTPACPNGYVLSSFTALYTATNSALYYQGECKISAKYQCPEVPPNEPPYTLAKDELTCFRPDQEQYTLTLAPVSATIEPGKSYTFAVQVIKQDGSPPSKPVPVSVKVEVDPTSGGHIHGESYAAHPKGGVSPASGNTSLTTTFTSTEVSGTHTITASCDLCVNKTATATVDVKIPGLIKILSTPVLYSLIGAVEGKHTDNHYLTPAAVDKIWGIAADYHIHRTFWRPGAGGIKKQIPPPPLGFNDASLIWGGKFDLSGKWSGSHYEHDKGLVIDIRANGSSGSVPETLFTSFVKLVAKQNVQAVLECTSNKVDGQGRTPPSCIGRDGSSDNNRHYHIKIN